jgi:cytochrome b561
MIKNTEHSFGIISIVLHWLVGVIIISLLTVGFIMSDMPNSDDKFFIYGIHKATGTVVLGLIILRLIWKLSNSKVLLPDDLPIWQKTFANITYILLYILMFCMPASGIMMSYYAGYDINVFDIFVIHALKPENASLASVFKEIHEVCAFSLVFLVIIHIGAALYHHFIRKDNILKNMLGINNSK